MFENVNLKSVCEDVISELEDKAEKKKVTISLKGSDMIIRGIRPVLHEMIYNLCDNAIVKCSTINKADYDKPIRMYLNADWFF